VAADLLPRLGASGSWLRAVTLLLLLLLFGECCDVLVSEISEIGVFIFERESFLLALAWLVSSRSSYFTLSGRFTERHCGSTTIISVNDYS
jgi:hypothetical protein